MNKEQIEAALARLGELLNVRRVAGEIAIFGGAALVLGFEFRDSTLDIDALISHGHDQVTRAAQEVGGELSLPPNWLNEQATVYLARQPAFAVFRSYPAEGPFGLRVLLAAPEYILAMKLLALRLFSADRADILALARKLRLGTAEQLVAIVKQYYPDEAIDPAKAQAIRDLARGLAGGRGA